MDHGFENGQDSFSILLISRSWIIFEATIFFFFSHFLFLGGRGRGEGGGYGPSRLFHSFWAESFARWVENGDPREKPSDHPQADLGLSHMWPELG